jgi:hypothetical protein
MDIGRAVFAAGQTYVALSRVKTLDGLYLSDFNPLRIKADPLVVDFYESFPKVSAEFAESETHRILSKLPQTVFAKAASSYKQTKLFVPSTPNPFATFVMKTERCTSGEMSADEYEPEVKDPTPTPPTIDPTVKKIKLGNRYPY